MSAIRKLLCAGLASALALGALGGRGFAAEQVSLDNLSDDTSSATLFIPEEDSSLPRWKRYSVRKEEPAQREPAQRETAPDPLPANTVGAATPAMRDTVHEWYLTNPYSVGWITVPGTEISDVVMKNPMSLDNSFYLTHDFSGRPDKNGMYCADYRSDLYNPREKLSRITAIYGHSWSDDPGGTLFSQLKAYRDPQFAKSHPYIYFSNSYDDMAFEVFAVFDTSIHLPYIRPNLPEDTFAEVLGMVEGLSIYDYGAAITSGDKLLTLSTCTYSTPEYPVLPDYNDYRFVVMAKLVEPDAPKKEESAFTVNDSPLPADATLVFRTPA